MQYRTTEELEAGLDHVRASPKDSGMLRMIVRRPTENQREQLEQGELSVAHGLVGDSWTSRSSLRTEDHSPHPDMQVAIINARLIDLVAGSEDRWALAGDQLVVDMDLSIDNLPPGTQLAVGEAVIEVTDQLHTGCQKFSERYGAAALRFVSTEESRALRLRGMYARVAIPGTIRRGDDVHKTTGLGSGTS